MNKLVQIENVVVVEQAEIAGECVGFLLGAAMGAKIISSAFWWLGPVATPVTVASGIFLGGTVGAIGGGNLGKVVVSQFNMCHH